MNEFIRFILYNLKTAMGAAVLAAALCALALWACRLAFKRRYKGERRFPWGRAILAILFAAYLAVLLYVTLLRTGGGYRYANLRPFEALREAWNLFSLRSWLNLLLNIAMFIPLGAALPLLFRRLRRAYLTLAAGFGATLFIEGLQYLTHNGVFDVDDLIANTLGAMLGYCAVMLFVLLRERPARYKRGALACAALPLATALFFGGVAAAYQLQPFGNLEFAATHRADMSGVEISVSCVPDDAEASAAVYSAEAFDREECGEFGLAFLARLGETENIDVSYYDNETFFMDHSIPSHSLIVYHLDRSYDYSYRSGDDGAPAEADRETLTRLLCELGVAVPERADFEYKGDGWHRFSLSLYTDGDVMLDGSVRCRYTSDGALSEVENHLVEYKPVSCSAIISQAQAIQRFRDGRFGGEFEYLAPAKADVSSVELTYRIDSKGFYQPVYTLSVDCGDGTVEILIPALA